MDTQLYETIMDSVPKLNPKLIQGFSTYRLSFAEQYIREFFKITEPKFQCDFKLVGMRRATPEEWFYERSRPRYQKGQTYELTESNFYLVKTKFALNGKELKKEFNLFLPYSKWLNLIIIKDSLSTMLPVVADAAISVTANSLFVPTSAAPLSFMRTGHSIRVNGEVSSGYQVVYAKKLHQNHEKQPMAKRVIQGLLTLVHYVLCYENFWTAVKRFTNSNRFHMLRESELENFPDLDQYDVYTSKYNDHTPPRGWRLQELYEPHGVVFVVHKDDVTPLLSSFIVNVLYILDLFAHKVSGNDNWREDLEDRQFWIITLGCIIKSYEPFITQNLKDMGDHLYTVEHYFDATTRSDLNAAGIDVDSTMDLFVWVMSNIKASIQDYNQGVSFSSKRLLVERYMLHRIVEGINKLAWSISDDVGKRKIITPELVEMKINKTLSSSLITRMSHESAEIETVQIPNDNAYFKSTQRVCPQIFTGRRQKKTEINHNDPQWQLTAETFAIHNGRGQLKNIPTGHGTLNMHVDISPIDGQITPHPSAMKYVRLAREVIG